MTAQRKKRFLAAFELTGNIYAACKAAEVGRTSVYRWQEEDDQFVHDFRQAEIASTERLELEAYRRAHDGVLKETPIHHNGKILYTIEEWKYSDTLLIFLLKARNPAKYAAFDQTPDAQQRVPLEQARKVLRLGASS